MRTRIYVDGKPTWSDDGPGFARVQGHGGAAMGTFHGVVLKPAVAAVRTAAAQRGLERKRLQRERAKL